MLDKTYVPCVYVALSVVGYDTIIIVSYVFSSKK